MTIVFDCNVVVNVFVFRSKVARQCWERSVARDKIIVSSEVLDEYKHVFPYVKFDRYVKLETRLEFIIEIEQAVNKIEVTHIARACRDVKDDMYLELALSGQADCIITNDADLLTLHPFENTPIISPKEFFGLILTDFQLWN